MNPDSQTVNSSSNMEVQNNSDLTTGYWLQCEELTIIQGYVNYVEDEANNHHQSIICQS